MGNSTEKDIKDYYGKSNVEDNVFTTAGDEPAGGKLWIKSVISGWRFVILFSAVEKLLKQSLQQYVQFDNTIWIYKMLVLKNSN